MTNTNNKFTATHILRLLGLFIMLACLPFLQTQAQTIPTNEVEPNGTAATATPITTNPAKIRGVLNLTAPFAAIDGTDMYTFTAAPGTKLFAALMTSFTATGGNSTLDLLAADGTTIIETDLDDGTLGATASTIAGRTLTTGGVYYLRVTGSAASNLRPYDLYVNVVTGAPTAEVENNDSYFGGGTANPVIGNGLVSGACSAAADFDNFSIALTPGQTVVAILDGDPERDNVQWNPRLGIGILGDLAAGQISVVNDASVGSVANPLSEFHAFTVNTSGTYIISADPVAVAGTAAFTYNISIFVFSPAVGYTNYPSLSSFPLAIPNPGTITSTVTVPAGVKRIKDLRVRLSVNANSAATGGIMGDLDAYLVAPNGNKVHLVTDVGNTTSNATLNQVTMDLWLDDYAAIPVGIFTLMRPVVFQPEISSYMEYFKGEDAQGVWTLNVFDDLSNTSTLSLASWSIDVLEETDPTIGLTTVYSEDFEATDGGYTHVANPAFDEWEWGTPATVETGVSTPIAGFTTANSGVKCWKSDLDNTYENSSGADLFSPSIDLSTYLVGSIYVSWAMKFQMESASFDHMYVTIEEVGNPTNFQPLYIWRGATGATGNIGNPALNIPVSAGWGTYYVDVSAFAGKIVRLKFHYDGDSSIPYAGLAIDDVKMFATPQSGCTTADGGIITPATQGKCSGQTATMAATGFSTGTGTTYQWKTGPQGGPYVNVTGGSPAGGAATSWTTGALTTGTYYYVLETTCATCPATPCSDLSNELTVTVDDQPTVTGITVSPSNPACGSATLSTAGGTFINSYLWAPGGATSPTIPATLTGTYTVTVTSAGTVGCTASTSTAVTINPNPTHSSTSGTPTLPACAPGSASITGTVTGGTVGDVVLASSGAVNMAIPDNNATGISSMIVLPAFTFTSFADLKVRVNVGHSWCGDVRMTLTSPCGNTIIVHHPGVPASTFGNSDNYGTNNASSPPSPPPAVYTFTTTAATPISETSTGPGFVTTGSYKPSEASNPGVAHDWTGITFPCAAAGNWTLTVVDIGAGDIGTLIDWAILGPAVYTHGLTGPGTITPLAPSGVNNSTGNFSVSGIAAGAHVYQLTSTDGLGCSVTTPVNITINANPVETATNNGPKCETELVQLSLTSVSPNPPTGWAWTGPNTFSSNVQNPTNGPLVPADAGTYNVTYTDANGCTGTSSTVLVVGPAPSATIPATPTQQICGGSGVVPVNLTGTAPWSFTLFDGTTSVPFSGVTNASDNYAVPAGANGTHNWTVTVVTDNACGSGNVSGSATIIVSSSPPLNTVSSLGGATAACSGSVALMSTNTVNGQNINYSWNTGSNSSVVKFSTNIGGPFSPGPFMTTTNSVYAEFGALAGGSSGYNICVQGINGCGSTNNKCTWIRGIVSPPAAITGSAIQCSNAMGQAYSSAAVPSATIYTWSFSVPGASFSGQGTQNVSVDFPVFSSGNLCVTAALSCGGSSTSAPKCMAISSATANPGVMTGPNKICPGQTGVVYSIPAIAGASTYNWTVPAGATITANTGPSITVSWPNPYTLNQSVCVTATSVCGAISAARCKSVSSGIPSTPGYISGQSAGVCGQTIVYSVAGVAGATSYTWVVPAGGTINSGQGTNSISVTWGIITTGQMSVTANSACGSSGLRILNIAGAPATPGTISQLPGTVCNGGPANFSIAAVTGATGYIWTVPANGSTIDNGQGTTSIDVTWGTGAGTVTVKSSNTCGVSPSTSNKLVTPGCKMASGSVSVNGTEMNLVAYPNPAHEKVTVSFNASVKEDYSLNITDLTGRVVSVQSYSSSEGVNTLELDLSTLAKGVYTLEVKSALNNNKVRLIME